MQQAIRGDILDNVPYGIDVLFLRIEYNAIRQLGCPNPDRLGKEAADESSARFSPIVPVLQTSGEPNPMRYQGKTFHLISFGR